MENIDSINTYTKKSLRAFVNIFLWKNKQNTKGRDSDIKVIYVK